MKFHFPHKMLLSQAIKEKCVQNKCKNYFPAYHPILSILLLNQDDFAITWNGTNHLNFLGRLKTKKRIFGGNFLAEI